MPKLISLSNLRPSHNKWQVINNNCETYLSHLPTQSVDAVITDPPYPCIKRTYGCMTENQWHDMMRLVIPEVRRVLKPSGSAVFILQPNSKESGSMRPWFYDFVAKQTREWNQIQDSYWWNTCALPTGAACTAGLLRGSIKPCVWLGSPNCFRDQEAVLWEESRQNAVRRTTSRARIETRPCGYRVNEKTSRQATARRGGTTPFNLIPFGSSGNGTNHGATTPLPLCEWWVKYICPEDGLILDPFCGTGNVGIAAIKNGRNFIGIERMEEHAETAKSRIAEADRKFRDTEDTNKICE